MQSASRIDTAAIGVSSMCVIHCLALPLLVSVSPYFSAVAEAEWVHKALVLAALPIIGAALLRSQPGSDRIIFAGFAFVGAAMLLAGAFVHELHDWEKLLTVFGALMLAGAHLFRWRCHASCRSDAFPANRHDT